MYYEKIYHATINIAISWNVEYKYTILGTYSKCLIAIIQKIPHENLKMFATRQKCWYFNFDLLLINLLIPLQFIFVWNNGAILLTSHVT